MRVLFTTWAWPAHYLPMVPLAWALRAAGHEVRMASQPELLPVMRESGLPSTVVGHDVDIAAAYREGARLVLARTQPGTVESGPPPGRGGRLSDDLASSAGADSRLKTVLETLRG